MRKIFLPVFASLTTCLPTHAQLTLGAGESYAYQFSTLEFIGTGPSFGAAGVGQAYAIFDPATFQTGDLVGLALFESGPGGSAFATNFAANVLLGTPYGPGIGAANFGWGDLQGSIEITQLSGSATLQEIRLFYYQPRDAMTANVYATTVSPVPEPGTIALLILGGLLGFFYYKYKILTRPNMRCANAGERLWFRCAVHVCWPGMAERFYIGGPRFFRINTIERRHYERQI
ncbi:MAG: PEP-CTERM sorting domain-containing protein [Verrucomicrobia subdivision 3 bacterium]|nr:PEP-CTERM sorting domain-containing protein [Limisphaerales bacterium]